MPCFKIRKKILIDAFVDKKMPFKGCCPKLPRPK